MDPNANGLRADEGVSAKAKAGGWTPLSKAKEEGMRGTVCCKGCMSRSGTLVGNNFQCNTKGCVYQMKPTPKSPWSSK